MAVLFGGSPRIHAGEERFRAVCVPTHFVGERSDKESALSKRFSAGQSPPAASAVDPTRQTLPALFPLRHHDAIHS